MGRGCQRQSLVYQCGLLDIENRCAVARFANGVWGLEEHAQAVYSLARQEDMGEVAGATGDGCGLRVADD